MMYKKMKYTLLYTVLFCNSSFAGEIPEELEEFSHTTYNTLPLSAEADLNLKKNGQLNKFLEEVTPIVEEHGLLESMGFRLAHRHDILHEGEKMIEKFDHWKSSPSFITVIEKSNDEKSYPASWLYTSSGIKVFEYSVDPEVKKVFEKLPSTQKVFEKIGAVAKKYELQEIIAPAILSRSSFTYFNKEQPLYEIISPSPYASVLINKSFQEIEQEMQSGGNLVRTTWSLKNPKLSVLCATYCHASTEDYKFHVFEH